MYYSFMVITGFPLLKICTGEHDEGRLLHVHFHNEFLMIITSGVHVSMVLGVSVLVVKVCGIYSKAVGGLSWL